MLAMRPHMATDFRGPPNFVKLFYSVNLLHTMISTVCTLCTAAHAISDDRATKMRRTACLRTSRPLYMLWSLVSAILLL
jgi:hypothetical protein